MEKTMKLLILGGSNIQLNTIKKAKEKGIELIVSDYNKINPGKKISDYQECVSTFNYEGTLEVARKYNVDGILTIGSDQPVLVVSKIQKELGLPFFIDEKTALAVTNKKIMKKTFKENNLKSVKYCLLKKGFNDDELKGIKFPVVIKPIDSQGQRGIYKLNSLEEIRKYIDKTLSYSKSSEVLLEEHYESDEITVSGWVVDGELFLLTVSDRLKFEANRTIGISYGHNFPSKYYDENKEEIKKISNQIVESFNIENGPVYFQLLVGKDGLLINEIACRIGGAFEDVVIPELTGVDIADLLIEASVGNDVDYSKLYDYDIDKNDNFASVQLFFVNEGQIAYLKDMNEINDIYFGIYNIEVNQKIKEIKTASERAGCFICFADNYEKLETKINDIFDKLKILDKNKNNLIISYNDYDGR